MIDFIKLYWNDKSQIEAFIRDKENFKDLYSTLEYHTGEIGFPFRANLENMNAVISEQSAYVKGSIHKLNNVLLGLEPKNHNDFTFSRIGATIDFLESKLTDVESAKITQLEFGLNILTDIPAENILQKNVLMHQYKGYNHNKEYHGRGRLKQFDHNNYVLKMYDKAKQYGLSQNILRYELKILRYIELQKVGIAGLSDLRDKRNLRHLYLLLRKRFQELLIVDEFNHNLSIPTADREQLNSLLNPMFWEEELRGVHSQKRARYRMKLNSLLEKHRLVSTQKVLSRRLDRKFIQLINN